MVLDARREIDDYFESRGRFDGAAGRYVGMAAGGEIDELVDFYAQQTAVDRSALAGELVCRALVPAAHCFEALAAVLQLVLRGHGAELGAKQRAALETELEDGDNIAAWLVADDLPSPDDARCGWRFAATLVAILAYLGSPRGDAVARRLAAEARSSHCRETIARNRTLPRTHPLL